MFGYIKGTIKIIESNYVIIDNNGIGYIIYVANPYSYEIDKDYTIYTYTFIYADIIILIYQYFIIHIIYKVIYNLV